MGVLTYYTYSDEPPIPEVVKAADGSILFTRADIMAGESVPCRNSGHAELSTGMNPDHVAANDLNR